MEGWKKEHVKAALASPRAVTMLLELVQAIDNEDIDKMNGISDSILADRHVTMSLISLLAGLAGEIEPDQLLGWGRLMAMPFVERN